MARSLLFSPKFLQKSAEGMMVLRAAWVQLQGLLQPGQGLLIATEFHQGRAGFKSSPAIARTGLGGGAILRERFLELALLCINVPQLRASHGQDAFIEEPPVRPQWLVMDRVAEAGDRFIC